MTAAAVPGPQIVDFDVATGAIDGLLVITMKQVTEPRGTVREFYRRSGYSAAGVGSADRPWAQINVTATEQGGIRGLHGEAMTKLVAVVHGEAFGAYVDARPDSPTRGAVETVRLLPGRQVLVPQGVCNGFQAVAPGVTQYVYCFDQEWQPGMAGVAVNPLDPALGIDWPIAVDRDDPAQLSAKDGAAPTLAEVLGG
ncbi:dTDP-4-dehydrorhamnose 3,5-epimerase family protein [Nakamurella endophytica]|uniref:dTDP-4-dehydrorhamnose 3,5-epimerase n=1 Tax=Nakamurella endophytica TaxID=1748367 RepID=A0A917T8N0_9ACTN|nr:dTDP-4-dehydrorhamnose 3,5-epimerase [Nakamurella endophytica]GGM14050.1 dTDP-4-dehydrorhamnose 3,5-epimerase [Nakamurella endophytica]